MISKLPHESHNVWLKRKFEEACDSPDPTSEDPMVTIYSINTMHIVEDQNGNVLATYKHMVSALDFIERNQK